MGIIIIQEGRHLSHSHASREPAMGDEFERISITDAHTMKESTL